MMQYEMDFYNKPYYLNRNAAIPKLISDYLRYHDDKLRIRRKTHHLKKSL